MTIPILQMSFHLTLLQDKIQDPELRFPPCYNYKEIISLRFHEWTRTSFMAFSISNSFPESGVEYVTFPIIILSVGACAWSRWSVVVQLSGAISPISSSNFVWKVMMDNVGFCDSIWSWCMRCGREGRDSFFIFFFLDTILIKCDK